MGTRIPGFFFLTLGASPRGRLVPAPPPPQIQGLPPRRCPGRPERRREAWHLRSDPQVILSSPLALQTTPLSLGTKGSAGVCRDMGVALPGTRIGPFSFSCISGRHCPEPTQLLGTRIRTSVTHGWRICLFVCCWNGARKAGRSGLAPSNVTSWGASGLPAPATDPQGSQVLLVPRGPVS